MCRLHRLDCVHDQVQDHLLQLNPIALDGRPILGEHGLHVHAASLQLNCMIPRTVRISLLMSTAYLSFESFLNIARNEVVQLPTQIKAQIEDTTSDYDREKLQERLAKLSGGVAVIKVGAATEVELKEKKHRIEDALSTTRAAVEEGLVAGGGTTLLQSIPALDKIKLEGDAQVGVDIVRKALEAPARQIADNAGQSGEVVVAHVKGLKPGFGYDALKGEYGDMFKAGIVDAAKVTRSALQNAASIAAMVLTTETLVTDMPEKEKAGAGGGHDHGGGGMDF